MSLKLSNQGRNRSSTMQPVHSELRRKSMNAHNVPFKASAIRRGSLALFNAVTTRGRSATTQANRPSFAVLVARKGQIESYLEKKSTSNRHLWQRRFFILDNEELCYWQDSGERDRRKQPQNVVNVSDITGALQATHGKGSEKGIRLNITLRSSDRVFELLAETPESAVRWSYAIAEAKKKFYPKLAPVDVVPAHHVHARFVSAGVDGKTVIGLKRQNSPLEDAEELYFGAFKAPYTSERINHFWSFLQKCDRHKWNYILENYMLFPLLQAADNRLLMALCKEQHWQDPLISTFIHGDLPALLVKVCPLASSSEQTHTLTLHSSAKSSTVEELIDREKHIFSNLLNILVNVHMHMLLTAPKTSVFTKMLTTTLDTLDNLLGWTRESISITRQFLFSLVKLTGNRVKKFKLDVFHVAWANVTALVAALEDFLFGRPVRKVGVVVAHKEGLVECHVSHAHTTGLQQFDDLDLLVEAHLLISERINFTSLVNTTSMEDRRYAKQYDSVKKAGLGDLEFLTTALTAFNTVADMKASKDDAKLATMRLVVSLEARGHFKKKQIKPGLEQMLLAFRPINNHLRVLSHFVDLFSLSQKKKRTSASKPAPSPSHNRRMSSARVVNRQRSRTVGASPPKPRQTSATFRSPALFAVAEGDSHTNTASAPNIVKQDKVPEAVPVSVTRLRSSTVLPGGGKPPPPPRRSSSTPTTTAPPAFTRAVSVPLVASNKVVASPPPSYTAVDVSAPADSIQGVLKQLFPNEDCGEVVTTLDENMYDSLASLAEDQEWHTLTTIPANILQALIGYIEKI